MSKFNFEVLHGSHYQDGKRYQKGAVIGSAKRLDKIFVNKFKILVGEDAERSTPPEKNTDPETDKLVDKETIVTKQANGKYVVFMVEKELLEDLSAKEIKDLTPAEVEDSGGTRLHEGFLKLSEAKALLDDEDDS